MLNSSGRTALMVGFLAWRQVWWGDTWGHSGRGKGRDECWKRVLHRVVDGHGFLGPSFLLCQVVLEEREVMTYPRHLVRGLWRQQHFSAPLLEPQ